MSHASDIRQFVAAAEAAGHDYDEVKELLEAAGFKSVDVVLPGLWESVKADQPPEPAPEAENTSGTRGLVPPEVSAMGFCWGAFALTWVWGAINRVPAAFALIAVPVVGLIWHSRVVVLAATLAMLAGAIWLGSQGHRLAWRKRRFDSVLQFHDTMREWNRVGLFLFAFEVVSAVVRLLMRVAR